MFTKKIVASLVAGCLAVLAAVGAGAVRPARAYDGPLIQSVSIPSSVHSNHTYTGTVTLTQAAAADTVVTLGASGDGSVSVPSHVTVLSGQSSVSFNVELGTYTGEGFSFLSVTASVPVTGMEVPVGTTDTAQALWAD